MSESLAAKYRPSSFDEICGQASIVRILTTQVQQRDFKNAYLFVGASGCGKTTSARALAYAINKGKGKPIEIDGASYSGVDNIRQLVADAQERSLSSEYKIYIIDEAHALSSQSWQAFLKCIEEPPKYTIFIFCTTEVHKVPDTIKNRCQVFSFTKIDNASIANRLLYIAKAEDLGLTHEAADLIAKLSNGSMRQSIANFEKCIYYNRNVNADVVKIVLGDYSYDIFFRLTNAMIDQKFDVILDIVQNYYDNGNDLKMFIDKYLVFIIGVAKYMIFKDVSITSIPESYTKELDNIIGLENPSDYYNFLMDRLLEVKNMLKVDSDPKTTIEVSLIQICRGK